MIKTVSFEKLAGTTLGNYHLDRFIGQSNLGPAFLARADASTTYLLRFLDGPMYAAPKEREVYLEHFQYQANQIAALQHPYILPLTDFGIYRGFPYLISPHIPLRSLRTRVEKNGALNTFTVGRYLDQIATALEYAHEHSVLHGSLSMDSIFIRLDGQLVIADIGVKNLLEHNRPDMPKNRPLEWSDGCAPEQLLGKPASPASDVYALGVVIYYLLMGFPVFEGSTSEEIAQQHLYSSIPPLSQERGDLPAGLYSILARALAKDPMQRYHQPGAFANAYHNNVAPINRTRMPFVVSSSSAIQDHQMNGTGVAAEAQFVERAGNSNGSMASNHAGGPPNSTLQHSLHGFSDNGPMSVAGNPRPTLMRRFERKQQQRTVLIAALVALLVIVSSIVGINAFRQKNVTLPGSSGQVIYFANQNDAGGQTNELRITIQNLAAPPSGYQYEAWIINERTESITDLGKLTGKNATWSLTSNGAISDLLDLYDKLEITQEQGTVQAPRGTVILAGSHPMLAFSHIQHLLVTYPQTPGKVGFLTGLLQQSQLLNVQASVLQSISASRNATLIDCAAQSMLDIIEGTHGSHYQPLARTCMQQNITEAGDGYGLTGKGYIAGAEEHASLALSQSDATSIMRQHADLMDVSLTNIGQWLATIEQDLLSLQAHSGNLITIPQITTLTDNVFHGVDINGDGQIDPILGEAGAITAFQQGELMASLTLTAPA